MDVTDSPSTGLDYQIQHLWMLLSGVNSVLVVLLFATIAVGLYLYKPAKWWAIAVLLDVSTFAFSEYTGANIVTPLYQIRLYGRAIVAALLVALLLPAFLSGRGWRLRPIMPATFCFVLFELVITVRSEGTQRLVLDIVTYALTFFALALGVSRWVQSLEDADDAVKAVALAGVLFLIGSLGQAAIDVSQVVWNGRFMGTTGNPNHAGALLAITLLAMLYLMLSPNTAYRWRVFYAVSAVVSVGVILWTGSRTAALMALVGVAVQFRRRLGAMVIVGILILAGGLVILQATSGDTNTTRFLSTDDTRTAIWQGMIATFLNSPVLGDSSGAVTASENSYLLVAAKTGLVGLAPLVASLAALGIVTQRLWRGRRQLRQFGPLADVVMATIAAELAGAFFEGFLLGVVTLPVFTLYIYFGLTAFLDDVRRVGQTQGEVELDADDYPVEAEVGFRPYGQAQY